MSTSILPTTAPPPPVPAESIQHERVIQRQLGRASLHVRMIDLASSLAVWAIGVIVLFIAAAVADHLIGLGLIGRFLFLSMLVGGSAYYLAKRMVPLLVRTINPAYAARTIEEATPTLKNSLINFLLLRQDRSGIREIVYQAIEEKAANDIAALPVEATVDRAPLIRAGYVLCGVMAVLAAYKILSPKDPFQTVARVLLPWAEIARPSRVQISDVQPGNAEVYYGQTIKISANIDGVLGSDRVTLRYTTADGQTVDRTLEMALATTGRCEATLPPEADAFASAGGLQQDVTYRIVAGDAESTVFRLRVIAAPTIIVDRVEYEYPAYTKKPPQTVSEGDIKGLEGTKVTIHGVANQPIKIARIDFDPRPDLPSNSSELSKLTADATRASGTITLQLKADRQNPWHSSYQLRFYNQRDEKSQQPVLHKIEVIPDLPPEVQILQPQRVRVEVPEDGEQLIEVRAVDPDYGLSRMRIEGSVGGKLRLGKDLLEKDNAAGVPQATVRYSFRPSEHKLTAGDELKYLAVAEDNRTSPETGEPEPNVARTPEYTLIVVPPQKTEQRQDKGKTQARSASEASPRDTPPSDKQQGRDDPPRQPDQPNQRPTDQGEKEQQPGQQSRQQGDKQQQGQPDGQSQRQEAGERGQGKEETGQGTGDKDQQNKPQRGEQGIGSAGTTSERSGESPQSEASTGGAAGTNGKQSQTRGQSGGEDKPAGGAGQQANPQTDSSGQPGASGTPEAGQGKAHDGAAIEEVLKRIQRETGDRGQGSDRGQGTEGRGQELGDRRQETAPGQKPGARDERSAADTASRQRLPNAKQGDNASEQKSGGNEGGAPDGATKSDRGESDKEKSAKGEQRAPGAAKTGDEGAGAASQDKSGSGDGTRENRDRIKEQQPDGAKPEQGEPSPASASKRQSDSKGGQSGEESGGGKQGAGQSAAQEGNDSAGSKSAADQGAGRANETGSGETGSKAGEQQQAAGKTGQSGDQRGAGSSSRPDEQGSTQSKASGGRQPSEAPNSDNASRSGGPSAPVVDGGGNGNREPPQPMDQRQPDAADAANLEYARKATEMVLRHLKDEEHRPDSELLDKLGWTREDLAEFLRRWEALQQSAQETPDGKRELDEALRSLGLRDPANRKRAGGTTSDEQRGLRDAGNRSSPPSKYRDLFDAFRKGAARTRE